MNYAEIILFLFEEEPWQKDAACKAPGVDVNLFFPKRGQSRKPAYNICKRCTVRDECNDYANRSGTTHGIWGGQIRSEGSQNNDQQLTA